jgi:hypothetical protein
MTPTHQYKHQHTDAHIANSKNSLNLNHKPWKLKKITVPRILKRSASRPSRSTPGERAHGGATEPDWVVWRREQFLPLFGIEPRILGRPVRNLVVYHRTPMWTICQYVTSTWYLPNFFLRQYQDGSFYNLTRNRSSKGTKKGKVVPVLK